MNYFFNKFTLIALVALAMVSSVSLIENLASKANSVNTKEDIKFINKSIIIPKKQTNNIIAQQENTTEVDQEDQFVKDGFEGTVKVEILKVKRIQNPANQKRDTVLVSLRIKLNTEKLPNINNNFFEAKDAKTRNPDTFEEYQTIDDKHTKNTSFKRLPRNAWANAYFWSQVPENVEVVDIIIPFTEIFANIPIEG